LTHRVGSPDGRSGAASNADTTTPPCADASADTSGGRSLAQISLSVTTSGATSRSTTAACVTDRPV
jgi:hypothetical protein